MTANADSRLEQIAQNPTHTQIVANLNDAFRRGDAPGRLFITPGAIRRAGDKAGELLAAVRAFDAFSPDNDPYGERDFGVVEWGSDRFYWKIDYYDLRLQAGSPNPADPLQTTRVMTLMIDSEY